MRRLLWALLALLVLSWISAPWYLDWLWFQSEGYGVLFVRPWLYRTLLFLASFLVLFPLLWFPLRSLHGRLQRAQTLHLPGAWVVITDWLRKNVGDRLYALLFWVTLAIALLLALSWSERWLQLLLFFAPEMGFQEPLFQRDASFYLFRLPVLRFLWAQAFLVFGYLLLASVLLSLFHGVLQLFPHGDFRILDRPTLHYLGRLLGALLVIASFHMLLLRWEWLSREGSLLTGPTNTVVYIYYPALLLGFVFLFVAGLLLLLFPAHFLRLTRLLGLAGLAVAPPVLAFLLGPLYQSLVVRPDELRKEERFLRYHIESTLFAYGLNALREEAYPAVPLSEVRERLSPTHPALRSLRLWDYRPALETIQQLQTLRPQYSFLDVDIDRYSFGNEIVQVFLSVRELSVQQLPPTARTWLNLHFLYTHGYGIIALPVHEVSENGLPAFYLRDMPLQASEAWKGPIPARPQIYFGEGDLLPVVAPSLYDEIDYPLGEKSAVHKYQGNRGVLVGSWTRRLLLAVALRDLRFLVARAYRPDSRLLIYRNILERLRRFFPYVVWSGDPYPVITNEDIYWIVDGFTILSGFPYAYPHPALRGRNYIRNSVKAMISAYDGETRFYLVQEDPYLQALSRLFPGVLRPLSEAPEWFQKHMRYPHELFQTQAEILLRYHMREPRSFYNQEDLWRIPREKFYASGEPQPVEPYYVLLPLDEEPELVLMLPFTPARRENLVAWLAARNDGEHYGELVLYSFPRDRLIYGPMQIEARIDQDPEISKVLTLWSQAGSQVLRGNLLVLPVEGTILYVEPLFLLAEQGKIPELRMVIVSDGSVVLMRPTLQEALSALLGAPEAPAPRPERRDLLSEVRRLVDAMDAALRAGDLNEFARLYQQLRAVLAEPGPAPESRSPEAERSTAPSAAGPPEDTPPRSPDASPTPAGSTS